jgi:hypothetical protein
MDKRLSPSILLSPLSETEEGFRARNFYSRVHGFGRVTEAVAKNYSEGRVQVIFEDRDNETITRAYNPAYVVDEDSAIKFIGYCAGFLY